MKVSTMPQRSAEWYAARRGIPTASRFDSILTPKTEKPSAGQDKLICELIAESLLPPELGLVPTYVSPEMEQGMKLEGEARCCYELEYADAPVTEVGFVLSDCGLFGASPDGLVGDSGGVEIKSPNLSTHIGYVMDGLLPDCYKTQVHGSMIVTKRNHWDFFTYARHAPPFCIRIIRDSFTEKLEAELVKFVTKYNEARKRFGLHPIGNNEPI